MGGGQVFPNQSNPFSRNMLENTEHPRCSQVIAWCPTITQAMIGDTPNPGTVPHHHPCWTPHLEGGPEGGPRAPWGAPWGALFRRKFGPQNRPPWGAPIDH